MKVFVLGGDGYRSRVVAALLFVARGVSRFRDGGSKLDLLPNVAVRRSKRIEAEVVASEVAWCKGRHAVRGKIS